MARLLKSLRHFLGWSSSPAQAPRPRISGSIDTDFTHIREGDRVLIWDKNHRDPRRLTLSPPLQRGLGLDTAKGRLQHDDIIGRGLRESVVSSKPDYRPRVTLPSLDQYISMTPRHVTPIYAKDASVILSLLDIHVAPPSEADAEADDGHAPIQILESGTGHGALTLHLSRAIQAANTLPPPIPKNSQINQLENHLSKPGKDTKAQTASKPPQDGQLAAKEEADAIQKDWDAWRARRKAIVHTVEVSPAFSNRAEKIVRGFRRGIYAGNVDFYVSRLETWIAEQIRKNTPPRPPSSPLISFSPSDAKTQLMEPFLTHAILDMPSANLRIPNLMPLLKTDAILAVFMPSVTQIAECAQTIKKFNLTLSHERTIELGTGISGGRDWDVRVATKKSKADPGWSDTSSALADGIEGSSEEGDSLAQVHTEESKDVIVCRPLAGQMIGGGGFVGIWRKMEPRT